MQETDFVQPKPVALEADNVTSASFMAYWEPVLGTNVYLVDVSPDEDFSSFMSGYQSLEVEGTSVLVTGLSVEETYYYRVRAKKDNTISENSNIVSVVTGLLPAPQALEPSDKKVFEFTANWSVVDEAASYLIEVASDPGFNNILADFNSTELVSTSALIDGLDYRETYYYRVKTKRLNKTSVYSNVIEVKPVITETCKLSKITLPATYTQSMSFEYDENSMLTSMDLIYVDFPTYYDQRWDMVYEGEQIDSVLYYYEGNLDIKFDMIYDVNDMVSSMMAYDPDDNLLQIKDYIYNDSLQLIGYRTYSDATRSTLVGYADYTVDENGNVLSIIDYYGDTTGNYKYDDKFNPKMLIPSAARQFLGDSFSGFNARIYHGINNPVYATGVFSGSTYEEEVFIYDLNDKDISTDRKGFYSLSYEFTGCNF